MTRPGFRRLLGVGTALGVLALASALVWIVSPSLGPYETTLVPLTPVVGDGEAAARILAALQAALGALTAATGFFALFGRPPTKLVAWLALSAGVFTGLGFVGFNGLAAAGYTVALFLPVALVATVLVMAIKRPRVGIATAVATLALLGFAMFGPLSLARFYGIAVEGFAGDMQKFFVPLLLVLFAGVWMLLAVQLMPRRTGAFSRFVLRHRVLLTVLAALCSLPYVVARLTWLTPWPLFGGEAAESPEGLATGLMLGAGMLAGGILTLGLILPWGEAFPNWFPRVGGRPVPVALAVVPASIVAALFTAAGFDSILTLIAGIGELPVGQLLLVFVLPFWLWGPLLAMATWGYAQHRSLSE